MLIGYSNNLTKRKSHHFDLLRKNKHVNDYLQKAFNKYGEKNFSFEIIDYYEKEFLPSMEHYWCYWLDTHNEKYGYNIKPTDHTSNSKVAEETKKKISKANKGHKRNTPEQREAIRKSIIKSITIQDEDGNIFDFDSVANAARFIVAERGGTFDGIRGSLSAIRTQSGKRKHLFCKGYKVVVK